MGMRKKTTSQTSGSPSRPGVASLVLMTAVAWRTPLGGLHLFPHPRVERAARYVTVDVSLWLGDRGRRVQLQRLDQVLRGRARLRVRVPVAVVVLEPRAGLRRAPRIRVRVRVLATRGVLAEHEHPDPGDRAFLRVHVGDLELLRL